VFLKVKTKLRSEQTTSIDELLTHLDTVYAKQSATILTAELERLRSTISDADSVSVIMMFEGFLALMESRWTDVQHIMPEARARLLDISRTHEAARCAMALGRSYRHTDRDQESVDTLMMAYDVFEQLGDVARSARTLAWTVGALADLGDMAGAVKNADHAAHLAEQAGDWVSVAESLKALSAMFIDTNDLTSALSTMERARALYIEHDYQEGIGTATANIAMIYSELGEDERAIELLTPLLADEELMRDGDVVYNSLGNSYLSIGDLGNAYENFRRCLAKTKSDRLRGFCLNNIGNVYLALGDTAEALNHFYEGQELVKAVGDKIWPKMMCSIAIAYRTEQRYDEALAALDKADAGSGVDIDEFQQMVSWMLRADVLMHMGNTAAANEFVERVGTYFIDTHRTDQQMQLLVIAVQLEPDTLKALDLLKGALGVAREYKHAHVELELLKQLRERYEQLGDFQNALKSSDEHHARERMVFSDNQARQRALIDADHRMSEERQKGAQQRELLNSMLPEKVVERLVSGETVNDSFEDVSVIFLDIVGFTEMSATKNAAEVVQLLDELFTSLDDVCTRIGITKVKTVGDSYMAVAGLPEPLTDHAHRAAQAARDMMRALPAHITARIGIHCGPVTAGVIGAQRLQYDVWGDTVNVASRLEGTSEPNRIQVSDQFQRRLKATSQEATIRATSQEATLRATSQEATLRATGSDAFAEFLCVERGEIELKGKGTVTTYWLEEL